MSSNWRLSVILSSNKLGEWLNGVEIAPASCHRSIHLMISDISVATLWLDWSRAFLKRWKLSGGSCPKHCLTLLRISRVDMIRNGVWEFVWLSHTSSIFFAKEWMVPLHNILSQSFLASWSCCPSKSMFKALSFRAFASLLVKLNTTMFWGNACFVRSRYAIRLASTVVFPVPGPDSKRIAGASDRTVSCWYVSGK